MCKVKFQRCRGIRLESKPVSYSWFPAQVRPQVSNPGYSIRADILANVVADWKALTVISRHTLNRFSAQFPVLSCQFQGVCLFIQQHSSHAQQ
jgi:hypothetical protein